MIDREVVSFVIQRSAFLKFACEALNVKKIILKDYYKGTRIDI